jgi:ribosomal protein S18 acetylase RimI-like enzyme
MMITIRPATMNDSHFLWQLKVAAMRAYVTQVYGWNEQIVRDLFEKGFRPDAIQIIQVDGDNIGMYELVEQETHWFLGQIEILPPFQNRGIGTYVLQQIMTQVMKTKKSLRLQVFKINPATRLYARLGFTIAGETETHYQMELWNKGERG